MLRLLPFFLLVTMVAPAVADSVWQDGDATGALVGAFDSRLQGHFVTAQQHAGGLTVTLPGGTLEIEKSLGSPSIVGPLADFGDLQLHDNVYGWVHIQGDFRLRANDVDVVPRGLFFDPFFLAALDLAWHHDGEWLNVRAADSLISSDGSFQDRGPEPGAWALLQGDGDHAVMDWFAFGGAPFKTTQTGDDVVMELVGTIGDGAPDLLVRLEEDGHFAADPHRFVFRFNSLAAATVPAQDLLLERGGFSFHARDAGHNIVEMRLPAGMSGQVAWQQDLRPPATRNVSISDVDPYAPLLVTPLLVSTWDEPVWAELRIGQQTKVATHAASEVRFRLTGLQPETTYDYTLQGRDLAGNIHLENGTLTTGPRAGPTAAIEVTSASSRAGPVTFHATFEDGSPAPPGLVHVFIDKRAADERLSATADGFRVDVPADAKELRIEVQAPAGRVSQVLTFDADQDSPLPWWLALALLGFVRRR